MLRPCGNFKRSYYQDEAIFQTNFQRVFLIAFMILLIILPLLAGPYMVNLCIIIGIYIIGAVGLNILTGFTGLISLGHGALVGVGAYVAAILQNHLSFPWPLNLIFAGTAASLVGLVFGLPSLRIKGLYLAMSTLAGQMIFVFAVSNTPNYTGGDVGISVQKISTFIWMSEKTFFYYLVFLTVILSVFCARNLLRTKIGRNLIAIRDNDLSAMVLGVEIGKYRLLSFIISSFYAGIAGAIWAFYAGVIGIEQFSLELSVLYLSIILIGGLGTILGSIYGAIFVVLVPETLSNLATELNRIMSVDVSNYLVIANNGIFGLLIILFLIFKPEGLRKFWEDTKNYFKLWPYSY
jgi:branched-chain amino acid transport system permease protein